jgi:hypothetical protein
MSGGGRWTTRKGSHSERRSPGTRSSRNFTPAFPERARPQRAPDLVTRIVGSSDSRAPCSRPWSAACGVTDGPPPQSGRDPMIGVRRHGETSRVPKRSSPGYAAAAAAFSCSSPTSAKHWLTMCSTAAPRRHREGLVSEVAVPGRTAHEGKPASHDTSVPSPPHPPEGAGTLVRCGHRIRGGQPAVTPPRLTARRRHPRR